jgi:hypothetical protein
MADTTDLDSLSLDQLQALHAQLLQQQGGGGSAPPTAAPATSPAPGAPVGSSTNAICVGAGSNSAGYTGAGAIA